MGVDILGCRGGGRGRGWIEEMGDEDVVESGRRHAKLMRYMDRNDVFWRFERANEKGKI